MNAAFKLEEITPLGIVASTQYADTEEGAIEIVSGIRERGNHPKLSGETVGMELAMKILARR